MSEQQHAYLKAMGIDIWVERDPVSQVEEEIHFPPATEHAEQPAAEAVVRLIPEAESALEPLINITSLNWQELQTTVAQCQLCNLSSNRNKLVFGSGDQNASLMILGDAPSSEDEQQGHPFTGEASKLLTAMVKAMGYQRNQVYISNLVKCSTGENLDPSVEEVAACEAYLKRQVQLVKPDVILAMGSVTAQRLLKSKSTMNRLRGQLHYIDDIAAPVIVTYAPGYLLRSPSEKRKAWEDLQLAMKELPDKKNSTP